MDALTLPLTNSLLVLVAPHAASALMLELAARLAVAGRLRVLDGGNCFNVYPVARAVRRRTAELQAALARIQLARAFTCYQMAVMLAEVPCDGVPTLVIDLLATFYDENVSLAETRRLLDTSVHHLRRMSKRAPVVVSAKPPAPICPERGVLLEELQDAASQSWQMEPLPAPAPPMLWD
ncbi:MAG TPA: hypothetical protein G4N92_02235 [Anaerolineae bacterium]|nr:hypothetical protein [Anaerolineae bacterium]